MRKLSKPMETMIREAAYYEARQDGTLIRAGFVIYGPTNTLVALIDRGLATTSDAANLSLNWLTESGEAVRAQLLGLAVRVIEPVTATTEESLTLLRSISEASDEADHWDDVAYADARISEGAQIDAAAEHEGHDDYVTHELPGDAERIWDAENAAMEWQSILSEQDSEDEQDIDDMIFDRDQAALERLISDTSWMTDPVIISDAGLTRLMKALDHTLRQRRARRVRAKGSKQTRRPSRQR